MIKTIEALLRGYLGFRVNDEYFSTYGAARDRRVWLTNQDKDVCFQGRHIFRGWVSLYLRCSV